MDTANPYESGPPEEFPPQPEIDSAELVELAASLDERVGSCEPYSQLTPIENHANALVWLANRAALLRYAAALLRLASRDPDHDSARDLCERPQSEQFVVEPDDHVIVEIRHAKAVPEPHAVKAGRRATYRLKDRAWLIGCAIIVFVLMFLVSCGCIFWYMIVTGEIE